MLLLLFTGDDDSPSTAAPVIHTPAAVPSESIDGSDEPSPPPARFATESVVNREGRYSFGYPPRWDVVSDGSLTTLTSPKDDVIISIGYASRGGLASATTDLSELIRSTYEVLRMGPPRETTIGDALALVFKGRARNDDSAIVDFEVTTIQGSEGDNYALTVFSSSDADDSLDDVIDEVVGSFRIGIPS